MVRGVPIPKLVPTQVLAVQWSLRPEPPNAVSVMLATLPAQKLLASTDAEVGGTATALMVRVALELTGPAQGEIGFAVNSSITDPALMSAGPGM